MGTIKKGLMGGFSGKVGNMVGAGKPPVMSERITAHNSCQEKRVNTMEWLQSEESLQRESLLRLLHRHPADAVVAAFQEITIILKSRVTLRWN